MLISQIVKSVTVIKGEGQLKLTLLDGVDGVSVPRIHFDGGPYSDGLEVGIAKEAEGCDAGVYDLRVWYYLVSNDTTRGWTVRIVLKQFGLIYGCGLSMAAIEPVAISQSVAEGSMVIL